MKKGNVLLLVGKNKIKNRGMEWVK